MVQLSVQLYQHQQVARHSGVTHLVHLAVSAKRVFMLFMLASIRKVTICSHFCVTSLWTRCLCILISKVFLFHCNPFYNEIQYNVNPETLSDHF